MAEVEHSHIENVMQRTFFKTVALWKQEAGATRKGYKEFLSAMVYSLKVFEVEKSVDAYYELLDCFPQSKHTGIKRTGHFQAAFAERFADHELGELVTLQCSKVNLVYIPFICRTMENFVLLCKFYRFFLLYQHVCLIDFTAMYA